MDTKIIERAINTILDIEGRVLHHDPNDPGGETLCGISRVYHPKLEVWNIVDKLIAENKDKKVIVDTTMPYVISFYTDIWNKYYLSMFDPRISLELFDQIINPGPAVMTINIQRTINALNYFNPKTNVGRILDKDLLVDGKYGKITRNAIVIAQNKGYVNEIVHTMNALQLNYYLTRTENKITQRKYFVGWIRNRCLS